MVEPPYRVLLEFLTCSMTLDLLHVPDDIVNVGSEILI